MPRLDIVDELHDTLKSDVNDFFRGRGGEPLMPSEASPASAVAATAAAVTTAPTEAPVARTAKASRVTPLAVLVAVGVTSTFAAILYVSFAKPLSSSSQEEEEEEESSDE